MELGIEKRVQKNISAFVSEELEIARAYTKILYRELGNLLSAVILFGSTTRRDHAAAGKERHDIDILVILDDVRIKFSRELVETYRIINDKAMVDTSPERLHVQSMKLTSFWEYVRAGDPVAINILRSGVAIVDTGFFDPLQILLEEGRIRPSMESIWTYYTMAPSSLSRSEQHMLSATIDLYWACIDAAHAALMKIGAVPPTPEHVADLVEEKLAGHGHISRKHAQVMRDFFNLFKAITHREIKTVAGKDYDKWRKQAEDFVAVMREVIERPTS